MNAFVYFLECPVDGVKIGWSSNPQQRIKSIIGQRPEKRISVLCIAEGDRRAEAALHEMFAPMRRSGEWFEPCRAIRHAAEQIKEGGLEAVGVSPFTYDERGLSEHVISAKELADLIARWGDPRKEWPKETDSVLWTLRYRPPKDLTMTQFYRVVEVAEHSVEHAAKQIELARLRLSAIRAPIDEAVSKVDAMLASDALAREES